MLAQARINEKGCDRKGIWRKTYPNVFNARRIRLYTGSVEARDNNDRYQRLGIHWAYILGIYIGHTLGIYWAYTTVTNVNKERKKAKKIKQSISTLNVGTMTGKERKVADLMERREVDILCVQETRWKGEQARWNLMVLC